MARVAIVVPVHEDSPAHLLDFYAAARSDDFELAIVDSRSRAEVARQTNAAGAQYLHAAPSRGRQIRTGVEATRAPLVWIVHADARVSGAASKALLRIADGVPRWGRFDVQLPGLGVIAWFMNLRSRLFMICTGDQGMFVSRSLLADIGGFPDQPLMEDVEVSKRLKAKAAAKFVALSETIEGATRRWHQHGVVRTVLAMWQFRWRYWRGVSALQLYAEYYPDD